MSKIRTIIAWVSIIGGGIAFYFLYGYLVDVMRAY